MNIVVTGGSGFLGSFVVQEIGKRYNGHTIISLNSKDYNLVNSASVHSMYKNLKPDVVVHLAAVVGGIGANRVNPGRFFYDNMAMGLNMVEGARLYDCKKFVFVSTVCSYPKYARAPFVEDEMWDGYPEETNAPYGIAKKATMVMLQGYRSQYGLSGAVLVPTNLYGPNDHFDPQISHVIPALIKKFVDAKDNNDKVVKVWGDGSATREFLYVEDAARGIVAAIDSVDDPVPINLGSGYEISIRDLSYKIKSMVEYNGAVEFEADQPNGQPRRLLNTDRAKKLLGWRAVVDFDSGLQNTISWYLNNR